MPADFCPGPISRCAAPSPDRVAPRAAPAASTRRCRDQNHERDCRVRDGIARANAEQEALQHTCECDGQRETCRRREDHAAHPITQHAAQHVARRRTKRHPHADLGSALRDQKGEHAVHAHQSEQQGIRGNCAKRDRRVTLRPDRHRERVVQCTRLSDRQRGVQLRNRATDRRHERFRCSGGVHDPCHPMVGRLAERHVDRRRGLVRRTPLPDRGNDAHNGAPCIGLAQLVRPRDASADRIFARPELRRSRLVDEGDTRCARVIALGEPAAADQVGPCRPEVTRRDHARICARPLVVTLKGTARPGTARGAVLLVNQRRSRHEG